MRLITTIPFFLATSCATPKQGIPASEHPTVTVLKDGKKKFSGCPAPPEGTESGRVVLLIDVDQNGKAQNIRVAESEPKDVWDSNAICMAKLDTFRKNEKGEKPPFKDYRHEIKMIMRNPN